MESLTAAQGGGVGRGVGLLVVHGEAGAVGADEGARVDDLLAAAEADAGLVQPPNVGARGGHPWVLGDRQVPQQLLPAVRGRFLREAAVTADRMKFWKEGGKEVGDAASAKPLN